MVTRKLKKPGRGGNPKRGAVSMETPANKKKFLEVYGETCDVRAAAAVIGIGRTTLYNWRYRDVEFEKAWKLVESTLVAEAYEQEAVRRGVHGVDEPVFYQGVRAGEYLDPDGKQVRMNDGVWIYSMTGKPVPEDKPITFKPHAIKKYSDTMLAMLLNGAKPEKYRQNHHHSGSVTVNFSNEDAGVL